MKALNDITHSHDDHHHHHHGPEELSLSGRRIVSVTLLNLAITLAEFVGGMLSGSLALLSDSLHNLSDTLAIVLSYAAHRLAGRPKNARKTFGYKRTEILAALLNSSALVAISIYLIYQAVKRFSQPEPIATGLMLMIALIGLLANLISVLVLHRDSNHSLNIRSSYLHLLGDTLSSVAVLMGGLAIRYLGILWIDPAITILISLYILRETWATLRTAVDILMQAAPALDYETIRKDLESMAGVHNLHHVHAWMSNENTIFFEAHIELDDMPLSQAEQICLKIEQHLTDHFGISHVTLQPEVNRCDDKTMFG